MKDFIDRETVIKAFENTNSGNFGFTRKDIGDVIDKIQSDIVRCCECKYFMVNMYGLLFCKNPNGLVNLSRESFCSYGEKLSYEVK